MVLAEIPDGIFMTYLSSNDTLAPLILDAFEQTAGSCTSYIGLTSGNHYAITDWNPYWAPQQVSVNLVTHCQSLAECLVARGCIGVAVYVPSHSNDVILMYQAVVALTEDTGETSLCIAAVMVLVWVNPSCSLEQICHCLAQSTVVTGSFSA